MTVRTKTQDFVFPSLCMSQHTTHHHSLDVQCIETWGKPDTKAPSLSLLSQGLRNKRQQNDSSHSEVSGHGCEKHTHSSFEQGWKNGQCPLEQYGLSLFQTDKALTLNSSLSSLGDLGQGLSFSESQFSHGKMGTRQVYSTIQVEHSYKTFYKPKQCERKKQLPLFIENIFEHS